MQALCVCLCANYCWSKTEQKDADVRVCECNARRGLPSPLWTAQGRGFLHTPLFSSVHPSCLPSPGALPSLLGKLRGLLIVPMTGEQLSAFNRPRMLGAQKWEVESNAAQIIPPQMPVVLLPWQTLVAPRFFSLVKFGIPLLQNWRTVP